MASPFASLFGRPEGNLVDEDEDRVIDNPFQMRGDDAETAIETPRVGQTEQEEKEDEDSEELEFSTSVVRSVEEVQKGKPQYSRKLRKSLNVKEKLCLRKEATQGIDTKVSGIDYSTLVNGKDEQLESNVEVEVFVDKISRHFLRYDMLRIFEKFPFLDERTAAGQESDRFASKRTVNLLKNWDKIGKEKLITPKRIEETIVWIRKFAKESSSSFLEDLDWTHHCLIDSMDKELQESVYSTLSQEFGRVDIGGPLTFSILIEKVINLSESAIESMTNHVKNYSLQAVPGEDVELVCRRLRIALKRLENAGCLTTDVIASLFEVFRTSSVEDFRELFVLWKQTIELTGTRRPHYSEILKKAEDTYVKLKFRGDWNVKPKGVNSTFPMLDKQENDSQVRRCYKCGATDHLRSACPLLQNSRRKQLNTPPSADMTPVSSNPDRFEKKVGDEVMKWCSKCGGRNGSGRWNRTHYTDEHIAGGPRTFPTNLAQCSPVDEGSSLAPEGASNNSTAGSNGRETTWGEALAESARRN